ncbi:hypothetical protein QCN28_15850 [Bordetella bronchiseptica]|uniref:Type III secretion protein n=1 Tax=Bordetella genomosp. 6 TaxID=463024 RepID=A0ABX4FAP8_9BORD|nr:hypothetical protein [Bordetella genomosp. 6]MBN3268884.1 hypothetical protein [Bordetella bronchiseptica]OZI75402.1 hypothetical protein CAL23_15860 [Bordetella genomosp. 6]
MHSDSGSDSGSGSGSGSPMASSIHPSEPIQPVEHVLEEADARLLTEVGFLAAAVSDLTRADAIFNALQRVRPGRTYPCIGLAVARMNAGLPDEAAEVLANFQPAAAQDRSELDAWCGFALLLAGRSDEARRMLQRAIDAGGDAAQLARVVLESAPAMMRPAPLQSEPSPGASG